MDVDSPGGEWGGMLDAADKIIAARGGKPIWAVANTCAASAAYALAGSAARLIVPRLAHVGSIGAVSIHLDRSAADQAQGLKYTAVFSGARKIDGWEHAPLSRDARASAQGRADYCRALFAGLVGRQGRISPAAALATEAEMFFDEQAVELNLADAVGTFEDAVNELADVSANRSTNRGASAMTKVAAVDPQPAASTQPAPAAPTPVAAAAAPAAPPVAISAKDTKAETCPDCGREYMPGDDDEAARANRYTLASAVETLELCMLAGASLADAKSFVAARRPVAKVRTDLAAKAAVASDALATDATRRNAPTATAGWDEVTDKVNKQFGIASKK